MHEKLDVPMLGGPAHGNIINTVTENSAPRSHVVWAHWEDRGVTPSLTNYVRERMVIFGHLVWVYRCEGEDLDDMNERAIDSFLTDPIRKVVLQS